MGTLSQPDTSLIVVDGKLITQQQYTNSVAKLTNSMSKRIKKLESLLEKVQKSTNKGVNINVQLLILKYSKMIDFFGFKINTEKAKMFSEITNISPESIRQFLSRPQYRVSNKSKRKNLNYVVEFFESFQNPKCQEAAKEAKKDLKRLPQDPKK